VLTVLRVALLLPSPPLHAAVAEIAQVGTGKRARWSNRPQAKEVSVSLYPITDPDIAGDEAVEVTDPRHPLHGRRFRLLAVTGGVRTSGFAYVEYLPDISLILSIEAISLHAAAIITPRHECGGVTTLTARR
jgi:hypothetical protein